MVLFPGAVGLVERAKLMAKTQEGVQERKDKYRGKLTTWLFTLQEVFVIEIAMLRLSNWQCLMIFQGLSHAELIDEHESLKKNIERMKEFTEKAPKSVETLRNEYESSKQFDAMRR